MQAVDADIQHIPTSVGESDGLLHLSVHLDFVQATEFTNAMVDVDHVVAHFQ